MMSASRRSALRRSVTSTPVMTTPSKLPAASCSGTALNETRRGAPPFGGTTRNSKSRMLGSPRASRSNGWSASRRGEPSTASRRHGTRSYRRPMIRSRGVPSVRSVARLVSSKHPSASRIVIVSVIVSMTSRRRCSAPFRSVMSTPVITMPSNRPAASRRAAALTETMRARPCGVMIWNTWSRIVGPPARSRSKGWSPRSNAVPSAAARPQDTSSKRTPTMWSRGTPRRTSSARLASS